MGADDASARRDPTAGFDALYGLEIVEMAADSARATVAIRDDLKQPFGLVHGGVCASIAEGLTSIATTFAVMEEGKAAVGLSNQTNFLRPLLGGAIDARATRRHAGATTWVWEVEMFDDEGRLCVITRMTLAVRGPRA